MPTLHLLAGPNGSGKSTYVDRLLEPVTRLRFVNADVIAAERWPDAQSDHAYDASRAASNERAELLAARTSFITETVFSHPSKLDLVDDAIARGYLVHLHVILLPVDVAVSRVAERVQRGGHDVPEQKIRERYARLWGLIAKARTVAHRTEFFDNSTARNPFRRVAAYEHGLLIGTSAWPPWTPAVLRDEIVDTNAAAELEQHSDPIDDPWEARDSNPTHAANQTHDTDDTRAVDAAWKDAQQRGEVPIPWDDVKRDLGLT